jgi:hypothetical protein
LEGDEASPSLTHEVPSPLNEKLDYVGAHDTYVDPPGDLMSNLNSAVTIADGSDHKLVNSYIEWP